MPAAYSVRRNSPRRDLRNDPEAGLRSIGLFLLPLAWVSLLGAGSPLAAGGGTGTPTLDAGLSLSGAGASADVRDLAVDSGGGSVIVGGFGGTVDFDPGAGIFNLTTPGAFGSGYVLSLDADQNFSWAFQIPSTQGLLISAVAFDGSGNIFIAGSFTGTSDFDPGPGSAELTRTSRHAFIARYDSSGNFGWVQSFGGGFITQANSIAVDASGDVFACGTFNGTVDFDPGVGMFDLTAQGFQDPFALSLDNNGNFRWAARFGGVSAENLQSATVDTAGTVHFAGIFGGMVDFGPGNPTLTAVGNPDGLVWSLATADGSFAGATQLSSPGMGMNTLDLATDSAGNLYGTGLYGGTVDFDPGPGVFNLTSGGAIDAYIFKWDSGGNFIWARGLGGSTATDSMGFMNLTLGGGGELYLGGTFTGTVDFDPGAGVSNLTTTSTNGAGYALRLDAAGDLDWAVQLEGDTQVSPRGISPAGAAKLLMVGSYSGTVDFDPGPGTSNQTSAGFTDGFIWSLELQGLDTEDPTITCPPNMEIKANLNCEVSVPDLLALATVSDNCPGVTASQSPSAGTMLSGIGQYTVTLTAMDAAGNTAQCDVTLDVVGFLSSEPAITSHAPCSLLPSSTETVTWVTNGVPVTYWLLRAGTTPGGSDIFDSGLLYASTTSVVVNFPPAGGTVYLRLWYYVSGWNYVEACYTAPTQPGPELVPVGGDPLTGTTVPFDLVSNGAQFTYWMMRVGSSPGAADIASSGLMTAGTTSYEVDGLPTGGTTVHVTLWLYHHGWHSVPFSFQAAP